MIRENVSVSGNDVIVKGKATIQLFDNQGEVVSEVVKNNFVSPRLLRVASQLTPYNAVYTNAYTWLTPHNHTYQSDWNRFGLAHSTLMLTTNDKPASPESDRYVEGTLIGWGRMGASAGGDITKSTFNTTESIATPFYRKLVYDFTTSQGNGTFQSIYTGYLSDDSYQYNYTAGTLSELPLPFLSGHTFPSYNRILPYNEHFWYATYSASKVYLNKIKMNNLISFHDLEGYNRKRVEDIESHEVIETNIPKDIWSIISFEIYQGFIYLVNSEGHLYKADMADLSKFSKIGSYTQPINQETTIFYSEYLGKLVVANQYGGTINFFELNGTKGTEYTKNTAMGSDIGGGAWREIPNSNGLVRGKYYIWDLKTMTQHSNVKQVHSITVPINDDYSIYAYNGKTFVMKMNQHFFSRVALDSPVTKTAQNTMKITYEFNIEPFPLNVDWTLVK